MSSADKSSNIRERLCPRRGDPYYLVLSDLRMFLERYRSDDAVRVLDYGAGNSPYHELFPNARYERADYEGSESGAVDFVVPADSALSAPDAVFDLVLSTQVAEHLPNPRNYFAEAYRVLKPNGRVLVTTHGVWEDHGVPFDFQRWTAEGLRRDLEHVGFAEVEVFKMTTSSRCHLFLVLEWLGRSQPRGRNVVLGSLAACCRHAIKALRPAVHLAADRLFDRCRIVEGPDEKLHAMYCIVAGVGRRPTAASGNGHVAERVLRS